MDQPEPDTPFAAVSAQTTKLGRIYQGYLDKSTPYTSYRWIGTGVLLVLFFLRIIMAQGWYIVCYSLGIYLLNLFLAFLQPKFDPSLTEGDNLEDGEPTLPQKSDEEFRPFIRRLPEFKFWHSATRAIAIAFLCTWFGIFNVPVFWPVLVMYFIILFSLTSMAAPRTPVSDFELGLKNTADQGFYAVRRQIQHMIKYRYVPFTFGKARYDRRAGH